MVLSISEAAQRLNISVDTVRRQVRSGALPAHRDEKGQWWLDLSDMGEANIAIDEGDRMGLAVGIPLQRNERESLINALEDQVDDLKTRLDRSEKERREAAEKFGIERDRLLKMIERLTAGKDQ